LPPNDNRSDKREGKPERINPPMGTGAMMGSGSIEQEIK